MRLGELLERSGLSHMRVQRMAQAGLFGDGAKAPGNGRYRTFDETDLLICTALAHLSELGLSGTERSALVARQIRYGLGRFLLVQQDGTVDRSDSIEMPPDAAAVALVDLDAIS